VTAFSVPALVSYELLGLHLDGSYDIATGIITLTWNDVPGMDWYEVQYGYADFDYWMPFGTKNAPANGMQLLAGTLQIEGIYDFRVRGFSAVSGPTNWSNLVSITIITGPTDPILPNAPTLATPANNASDLVQAVTLTWNAPVDADSGLTYTLQVSDHPGFVNPIVDVDELTVRTYLLPTLAANTAYYWRVRATNAAGNSDWSDTRVFLTAGTKVRPASLTATFNETNGKMTLVWSALTGWTKYDLQINRGDGMGWQMLQTDITGLTYTYMPPTGSYTYCYRVRGNNSGNTSDFSWPAVVSYTLPSLLLDGIFSASYNAVVLNWNPVPTAFEYEIQYRPNGTMIWLPVSTQNASSASAILQLAGVSGLTDFRVRSYSMDYGYSIWSNFVTVDIPVTP
jgi:hypothetical protein